MSYAARAQAIAARASASIVSTTGASGAGPAWMPSGISVQPSTTDLRRVAQTARHLGQRRVGVSDAVCLHQGDRGTDQPVHLILARHDAVPTLRAQPVLVEPHRQRRLGSHDADPADNTHAPQLGGGGIDDVQDRDAGRIAHGVVPAVRRVARDGDRAAAGAFQPFDAAQQPGQRISATLQPAHRAVRHARVGPQYGGNMILIARCWRQQRQPDHELSARQRAHAAQHAQHLPVAVHAASIGRILTRAQAETYAGPMRRRIELQGHRGARGLFPENTLVGFAGALAIGVDAIELDVAVTADDVVVVTHDPRLNPDITRTGDGTWLGQAGPAIRSLRAADLRHYDVGRIRPDCAYATLFPDQRPHDGA